MVLEKVEEYNILCDRVLVIPLVVLLTLVKTNLSFGNCLIQPATIHSSLLPERFYRSAVVLPLFFCYSYCRFRLLLVATRMIMVVAVALIDVLLLFFLETKFLFYFVLVSK